MAYMNPRLILLALWTCLAGILPVSAQQSDTRVALVIGNASYPDAEAPLRDPVNNVRALADELRRSGFDVDVGENLTKEAMRAAIDRFYGKIKPGSTALLFFSGYGIQSDRQTYVIPVNAQIWTEADVRRDGYSFDLLLGEMNKKRRCRQDRNSRRFAKKPLRAPLPRRRRRPCPSHVPKSTVVMYAAAPGAVARDGDRPVFVRRIAQGDSRLPGRSKRRSTARWSGYRGRPRASRSPGSPLRWSRTFRSRPPGGRRPTRRRPWSRRRKTSRPLVAEKPAPAAADPAPARPIPIGGERVGTKKALGGFRRRSIRPVATPTGASADSQTLASRCHPATSGGRPRDQGA